jgi:site-specific recombinase XerD
MGKVLSAGYAEAYEAFLAYEQPRVTRQGYESIRKTGYRLLKWFEEEEITLEGAGIRECVRYRNELAGRVKADGEAVSAGTVCNQLKAGKRLFAFLVATGKRETNPFREVKNPRQPERVSRNVLTEVQMGRLLETLAQFPSLPSRTARVRRYRLHVLAEFLYATGLRIAEAAGLIPQNVDTAARVVYVPEGKGQRPRQAFMTGYAADVMRWYLGAGREAVMGNYERAYGHTVFGTHPQRLMAVVNRELRALCRGLDIPEISSHGFRHSLGTHLLRAGCDMRYIQIILGHEALHTTQIYTRVDKDDLKHSLDKFHPRRWERSGHDQRDHRASCPGTFTAGDGGGPAGRTEPEGGAEGAAGFPCVGGTEGLRP